MHLDIQSFYKKLQSVIGEFSADDKLEFYEELLETGTACHSTREVEHTFSIIDLSYEKTKIDNHLVNVFAGAITGLAFIDEIEKNPKLNFKDEDIDEIVNSNIDDDPIDFKKLELEADNLGKSYEFGPKRTYGLEDFELLQLELINVKREHSYVSKKQEVILFSFDQESDLKITYDFAIERLIMMIQGNLEMIDPNADDNEEYESDIRALKFSINIIKEYLTIFGIEK